MSYGDKHNFEKPAHLKYGITRNEGENMIIYIRRKKKRLRIVDHRISYVASIPNPRSYNKRARIVVATFLDSGRNAVGTNEWNGDLPQVRDFHDGPVCKLKNQKKKKVVLRNFEKFGPH